MKLYYITAGRAHLQGEAWTVARMAAAVAEGVDWVQLREPGLTAARLWQLCRQMLSWLGHNHPSTRLFVNDRLDLALAAGAHGVHLPARGLTIGDARALAPPGFLVGLSCHSPAEARAAAVAGADFCVLGPVFATPSKPGASPLGTAALAVARELTMPVLALGGVDEARAAACMAAGAAGLAGIRLFDQATAGIGARLRAAARDGN